MKPYLALLLFLPSLLTAQEHPTLPNPWTAPDGQVLANPVIQKSDAAFILIMHDDGMAKYEIAKLTAELQTALNYDSTAGSEAAQAEQKSQAEAHATLAARQAQIQVQRNAAAAFASAKRLDLQGTILQVLPEGLLIDCDTGNYFRPQSSSSSRLGGGGGSTAGGWIGDVRGIALLKGHPKQETYVDGKSIGCKVIENGRFKYTNTLGAESTVGAFQWVEK